MYEKILVAGTFDKFHVGHQFFLWTTKTLCKNMCVVVARDNTVRKIKKKTPTQKKKKRLKRIQQENLPNTKTRLGREDAEFLQTLQEESPTALFLGYDQNFDEKDCKNAFPNLTIKRTKPYFPNIFKSSKFKS